MAYVDGYVLSVPEANRDSYTELALKTATKLRNAGATRVVECWAQDVPHGTTTDFYRATRAEEGETVVLAWVTWPDKSTRDNGWAAMMADPEMEGLPMPFDTKRMFWGGFEPIVDLGEA